LHGQHGNWNDKRTTQTLSTTTEELNFNDEVAWRDKVHFAEDLRIKPSFIKQQRATKLACVMDTLRRASKTNMLSASAHAPHRKVARTRQNLHN